MVEKMPSGIFRIRRTFKGLGRIQINTGVKNKSRADVMDKALDYCRDYQLTDLLKSVLDGDYELSDLADDYQAGNLLTKNLQPSTLSLQEEVDEWLENTKRLSPKTIREYRLWIGQVIKIRPAAMVSDLDWMLSEYQKQCHREEKYVTFNRTKAACQSFVKFNVKGWKTSTLYKDLQAIPQFGIKLTKPKNPHKPFATPYELDQLFKNADPWLKGLEHLVWFLCLHGFRSKEYRVDPWKEHPPYHLHIHGAKNIQSKRNVPLLMNQPRHNIRGYGTLQKVMKGLGRLPHDTRRTYEVWLTAAGIVPHHANHYMGHTEKGEPANYIKPANLVEDWIEPDQKQLLNWFRKAKVTPPITGGTVDLITL